MSCARGIVCVSLGQKTPKVGTGGLNEERVRVERPLWPNEVGPKARDPVASVSPKKSYERDTTTFSAPVSFALENVS